MAADAERSALADEIKNLERELDRKKERLRLLSRVGNTSKLDWTPDQWVRWADEMSAKIGAVSTGGDAAEDVRRMRDRG